MLPLVFITNSNVNLKDRQEMTQMMSNLGKWEFKTLLEHPWVLENPIFIPFRLMKLQPEGKQCSAFSFLTYEHPHHLARPRFYLALLRHSKLDLKYSLLPDQFVNCTELCRVWSLLHVHCPTVQTTGVWTAMHTGLHSYEVGTISFVPAASTCGSYSTLVCTAIRSPEVHGGAV